MAQRPTVEPAIKVTLMPRDTNVHGTIFGGIILAYIDQAGAIEARRHTRSSVVTVAMKEVEFKLPVFVGDLVSFYTRTSHIGRTSVTVEVEVWADRHADLSLSAFVTRAEVTYVAVGPDRRPVPVGKT
jgi:acyl-CoA thioesterase YciA